MFSLLRFEAILRSFFLPRPSPSRLSASALLPFRAGVAAFALRSSTLGQLVSPSAYRLMGRYREVMDPSRLCQSASNWSKKTIFQRDCELFWGQRAWLSRRMGILLSLPFFWDLLFCFLVGVDLFESGPLPSRLFLLLFFCMECFSVKYIVAIDRQISYPRQQQGTARRLKMSGSLAHRLGLLCLDEVVRPRGTLLTPQRRTRLGGLLQLLLASFLPPGPFLQGGRRGSPPDRLFLAAPPLLNLPVLSVVPQHEELLVDIEDVLKRRHHDGFLATFREWGLEQMRPLLGVNVVVEVEEVLLDRTDQLDLILELEQPLVLQDLLQLLPVPAVDLAELQSHGNGIPPAGGLLGEVGDDRVVVDLGREEGTATSRETVQLISTQGPISSWRQYFASRLNQKLNFDSDSMQLFSFHFRVPIEEKSWGDERVELQVQRSCVTFSRQQEQGVTTFCSSSRMPPLSLATYSLVLSAPTAFSFEEDKLLTALYILVRLLSLLNAGLGLAVPARTGMSQLVI